MKTNEGKVELNKRKSFESKNPPSYRHQLKKTINTSP